METVFSYNFKAFNIKYLKKIKVFLNYFEIYYIIKIIFLYNKKLL